MSGENTKSAIDVVADASVYGRLDPDSVDGESGGGTDCFRQLSLRLDETVPRRLEVFALRSELSEDFLTKAVRRFEMPDKQKRDRAGL